MDETKNNIQEPEQEQNNENFDLDQLQRNAEIGEPEQVNLDNEALKKLILKQNETINTLKAKYEALKEQNAEMALHTNFGNSEPEPEAFFRRVLGINQ